MSLEAAAPGEASPLGSAGWVPWKGNSRLHWAWEDISHRHRWLIHVPQLRQDLPVRPQNRNPLFPGQCRRSSSVTPVRLGVHLALQSSRLQDEGLGLIFGSLCPVAAGGQGLLQGTQRSFRSLMGT